MEFKDSGITRPEFNETVARIHQRVDEISKTGIKIETSAQLMKESVDKMCESIYGNGRSGLTSKITQLFERISLHTKLIMLLITSILGMAFYIIKESIAK